MSRQLKRRTMVVGTVLAVLTGYATVGPASLASAASLSGSSFEIDTDADLVVDDGGIDWLNGSAMRAGVVNQPDAASGGGDDSFTQGTHENSAVPTTAAGSIPPNKSDLKNFGVYAEKTGSNVFLNVFWTRVQDPSGTTNMDFEFNQSSAKKNDPAGSAQIIPVRTNGDLLLTYDLSNGGSVATISKRFWSNGSWGSATALSGSQAIGTINSSAISAANSGGLGSLSPRTFGEASVDLNALLPVDQGCLTYGSAYLKSRSSDSFNAELKDFIAPHSVSVSNCGAIKIIKTNGEGAALAGAEFKLYKDVDTGDGALNGSDTLVATKTTDSNGELTFTDVKKGDYWVHESKVPAGHEAVADEHVSITSGDQVVTLNLDDPFSERQDLGVSLTAQGGKSRDDLWKIEKSADKTTVNIADGDTATFNYTVKVSPDGFVDSDYTLGGTVHVTNPNPLDDITANVTVASNVGGGVSCTVTGGTGAVVPKSDSLNLPYTCTFSGTPAASGSATATVTWNKTVAHTAHDSATSAPAAVSFPIGAETHKTVTVVDDKTDPSNPVTLGTQDYSDGVKEYNYSLVKSGVGGQCTDYTNTAKLTETGQSASKKVTVCVGKDLTVTKTALATDHRTFLWDIAKDVDQTVRHVAGDGKATFSYTVTATPTTVTRDSWVVTGQISVTNPNHWESITADITDTVNVGGGASCVLLDGGDDVTIAALATVVLDYRCDFTSQPTDGENTATATWDAAAAHTPTGTATGKADVVFVPSSKTNETIHVVDDMTNPGHPVDLGTATWGDGVATFHYTVDLGSTAGTCTDYTNTASITETEQVATKTVTVCSGADLTLDATTQGSFARDDLWSISKAVDKTTATAENGQTVTFNYTVTATPAGFADSGYALGGTVTVTNPNDWETVTADVTVSTDLGGGAECTVTDGTGRSVPASGSLVLAYTCTFTGVPSLTGTVSATATWDSAAAFTPTGTASTSAPATLTKGTESHGTINVVDDKTDPAHPVALGPAVWADGPSVFAYSIDKTASGSACTTYTNVAEIVETAQTASQDVDVCGFTGGGGVITGGGGKLTFTGDYTLLMAEWALAALAAGLLLVMAGRRRRS